MAPPFGIEPRDLAVWAPRLTPVAVVVGAIAVGLWRGLGLGLLVLAAGVLVLAITMLWASVQSLGDDAALSLDEALALARPSAEEEKKRAVLRALKDLDYERGVGKISEDDFQALSTRYRNEAKRLLATLDDDLGPTRARAEKAVAARLRKAGLPEQAPATEVQSPTSDAALAAEPEAPGASDRGDDEPTDSVPSCPACDGANDLDARFCKHCGEKLG